jgi:hypothetical protein
MMRHRPVLLSTLAVVTGLVIPASLRAQLPVGRLVDSARAEIDSAVARADSTRLDAAKVLLDRALVVYPGDPMLLHYRGYAEYRQATRYLMVGNMKQTAPLVHAALDDLAQSGKTLAWPETFALEAFLTGVEIALDPSRGMELGPEIGALQQRADQLGPKNPRVLLLKGSSLVYTPAEYGGGKDVALPVLRQALAQFAADAPAPHAPRWGRQDAVAALKSIGATP